MSMIVLDPYSANIKPSHYRSALNNYSHVAEKVHCPMTDKTMKTIKPARVLNALRRNIPLKHIEWHLSR